MTYSGYSEGLICCSSFLNAVMMAYHSDEHYVSKTGSCTDISGD